MPTSHGTSRAIPKLTLVTDRHATAGRDLMRVVTRALDAGLPAVQLRDKDLPGRERLRLAELLREATSRTGALLFVNDRIDIAVAVGADGVQLGRASLPVDVARPLLPSGCLVGESSHTIEDVVASTADFVVFGPIYDTPSKRPFGEPHGEESLRQAVEAARVPVVAIGGIDDERAVALGSAGIAGVAIIRAISSAPDPAAATRALLRALS